MTVPRGQNSPSFSQLQAALQLDGLEREEKEEEMEEEKEEEEVKEEEAMIRT